MGIGRTGIMLSALNNSEYYMGLSLAKSEQVNILSQNSFWKDECTVSGTVDSGEEHAFVKVSFDLHKERAMLTSCTCSQKRGALCSHGVALSLVWLERAGREMKTGVATDLHLQHLVKVYDERQLEYYEEQTQVPRSKVRLQPVLVSGSKGFTLECRIGTDKWYVISDLAIFAQNVLQKNEVNYGKQLCFVHQPEAFHEESRALLEFVLSETMSGGQADRTHFVPGKARGIPVQDYNVDMLFRAVGDQVFMERSGVHHMVPVVEEEPLITLQLKKYTDEGIQLSIPDFYEIIAEGKDAYLLFQERIYRCKNEYVRNVYPLLEQFEAI